MYDDGFQNSLSSVSSKDIPVLGTGKWNKIKALILIVLKAFSKLTQHIVRKPIPRDKASLPTYIFLVYVGFRGRVHVLLK